MPFVGKRVAKGEMLAFLQHRIEAYNKGNLQGEIAELEARKYSRVLSGVSSAPSPYSPPIPIPALITDGKTRTAADLASSSREPRTPE